jgi:hypothetical protein
VVPSGPVMTPAEQVLPAHETDPQEAKCVGSIHTAGCCELIGVRAGRWRVLAGWWQQVAEICRSVAGSARSARVEVVGLDDVVCCGDQLPFCLDGFEAASCEAPVAALFFDGPEYRLDGVLAFRVGRGAFRGA